MAQQIGAVETVDQGRREHQPQQVEGGTQHQHLTRPQAPGQLAPLGFHPASAAIKLPISRAWRP
jgi:hypothetical protein